MKAKRKRRGRRKQPPRVSKVNRKYAGQSPGVVVTEVGQPSPYTTQGMASTYTVQHAERAYSMAAGGATDAEIAAALGISVSCFYEWRHLHPEFLKATQLGSEAKAVYDERVENALLSRAVGHQHPAVKILVVDGQVVYAPYIEHLPPDTNAARHWLNNRNPDRWKEKVEVEGSHEVTVVVKGGLPEDDDDDGGGGDAKT